jgi:hypothetical protein
MTAVQGYFNDLSSYHPFFVRSGSHPGENGSECLAELHWFEASGIGQKEMKVKLLLD